MDGSANPRMVPRTPAGRFARPRVIVLAAMLAVLAAGGCASNPVSLRSVPKSPLIDELNLASYGGPKPSERTMQLLRVYNLSDDLSGDYPPAAEEAPGDQRPRAVGRHGLCPVGAGLPRRQEGRAARQAGGPGPLRRVGLARLRLSVRPALRRHAQPLRPAVPRRLRSVQRRAGVGVADRLRHEGTRCPTPPRRSTRRPARGTSTACCSGSRWQPEDFERFEFVSDYEVKGLKNLYQTHGLGVPLIAVRHSYPDEPVGGEILSGRPEFPRDRLPAAAVENRSANRPDRRPQPVRAGTVRSADQRRDAGGRPAGAAGKRPDHAAGLFPLAARDELDTGHRSGCCIPRSC